MPKKIKISLILIARLKRIASGRLKAAVAIIKLSAVPSGIPFWKSTTAIGTIAAQLPYIGTPRAVAIGTVNTPVLLIIACTSLCGT